MGKGNKMSTPNLQKRDYIKEYEHVIIFFTDTNFPF